MSEMLGDDFTLNYDVDSNYSSPNWVKQTSVGDLQFDMANETPEIPKRIGTKVYKSGRQDWKLSITMNYDTGNTFHQAMRDAIRTGNRIHLAIAEGNIAVNTTDYWHAWWLVKGPLDASLDNPATYDIECMPHHNMGTNDAEIPAFVAGA